MNNQSKSAALYYLYGRHNAGDAAIGIGAICFLQSMGFAVIGVSRWPESFPEFESDREYYLSAFPGIDFRPGPFHFRRGKGIVGSITAYVRTAFSFFYPGGGTSAESKDTLSEASIIVLNGGNLLRCTSVTDFIRLLGFLYPLFLAWKKSIPYVILPQSTSRINWLGKSLIGRALSGSKSTWIREDKSLIYLKELYPKLEFKYGPDMAFFISEPKGSKSYDNKDVLRVAITVRAYGLGDISPFSAGKIESIVDSLTGLIQSVSSSKKLSLTLVIQSDKDAETTKQLFAKLRKPRTIGSRDIAILDERDVMNLVGIYRDHHVLVGMRLHSIIMALSTGTPCVGFFDPSWGLKNPGLLEKFGLPYAYIEDDPDFLQKKFYLLMEDYGAACERIFQVTQNQRDLFEQEFLGAIANDLLGG